MQLKRISAVTLRVSDMAGLAHGGWGRIIFYVKDVDECWGYLRSKGFNPPDPQDAEWGERYFHLNDADGHELSFAQPLQ